MRFAGADETPPHAPEDTGHWDHEHDPLRHNAAPPGSPKWYSGWCGIGHTYTLRRLTLLVMHPLACGNPWASRLRRAPYLDHNTAPLNVRPRSKPVRYTSTIPQSFSCY